MVGKKNTISVIVPVYNGAAFVGQAIQSILDQTQPATEILVIDDGSTDNTAEVVQQFGEPVSYHYQENAGSSAARNLGIKLARGEWLAFLDADDLWAPDKLVLQTAVIREQPDTSVVWGHVAEFHGHHLPEGILSSDNSLPGQHPGTALIHREALAAVGHFSQQFDQAEVVEWVSKLMASGIKQFMLPQTVMYRRIHGDNKGINNPEAQSQYLKLLKQHLDRKRGAR